MLNVICFFLVVLNVIKHKIGIESARRKKVEEPKPGGKKTIRKKRKNRKKLALKP
jgi:hypothetical protein